MGLTGNHADELVDLIYAALLGEATWQQFLDRLSLMLPGGASTLFFHDAISNTGSWSLASGLKENITDAYADHFAARNPWMKKAAIRPVGVGVVAEQMLTRESLLQTEFYNDFLHPLGLESAVGITIHREKGCSFLLSTLTNRADPERNREAADCLTKLAPHLQRAFRHYRASPHLKPVAELGGSLFDAIDVGLLIIGEDMTIKVASTTGQRLLSEGGVVRTSPLGKLTLALPAATALLQSMLERGFKGLRVQSLFLNSFKLTFVRVRKDRISAYFEGPTVIVLMEPPHAGSRAVDFEHLAHAFNLTAAEMRAMTGIVLGRSIDEIAVAAGVSRETIRTQLKNVYGKTGATGQADLVRLVTRGGGDISSLQH
ncbi:helix-turn-helix transcriptional regulator [Pseudaminobacter salicylatoxidans]|uniref:helix-turn-helix transcriptional regulator n=1 Tax=Pseudaminobacter salicylatoxidans TaxID=93369 RepID=UPI000311D8DD|nr:helix-turn-helix transcriptional regulator [Pseudaminobacter salicylatoxidans]